MLEYQNSQAAVADAKRHLASAEAQRQQLSDLVAARGAELYQGAQDPTSLLPNTNIQSVNELGVRTQYGAVATGNDEQLISNLVRAQQDLKIQRKQLDKQVAAAKAKRDLISATQQKVEEANSQETELLSQVKGQIATLIAAGESAAGRGRRVPRSHNSRTRATARRAFRPPTSAETRSRTSPHRHRAPRPRSHTRKRSSASRINTRRSGPNTFDCSGLTMMAWAAAGVSMPHYSGAQYAEFPHVPFDQLEPGDLLFWGPGGSEHVAMYIGGGLQIAATHTGDYVRIQPMGSNPVGAARP